MAYTQPRSHEGIIGYADYGQLERQRRAVELRLRADLSDRKRVQLECALIRIYYGLEIQGMTYEERPSNRRRVQILRGRQRAHLQRNVRAA